MTHLEAGLSLQAKHDASAGGVASNIDTDTHKTGMEPASDRARNLTDVAQVRPALLAVSLAEPCHWRQAVLVQP